MHEKYTEQVNSFKWIELIGSVKGITVIVAFGMFWLIWNFVEVIVINYGGNNKHDIEVAETDRTLKALPTFTR